MKNIRILIIDDNEIFVDDLSFSLRNKNYNVSTALSIEEGINKVLNEKFEYIIIDLKFEKEDDELEFGGISLFYKYYILKPAKKAIIVSAYTFEEQEDKFYLQLRNLAEGNEYRARKVLKLLQDVYVHKAGEGAYFNKIINKIQMYERTLLEKCKKYWEDKIIQGEIKYVLRIFSDIIKNEKKYSNILLLICQYEDVENQIHILGEKDKTEKNRIREATLNIISNVNTEDFNIKKLLDYSYKNEIH